MSCRTATLPAPLRCALHHAPSASRASLLRQRGRHAMRRPTVDHARGWRLVALALALGFACAARADDYPSQPIKLLVGFSAGGGLDISCRHLGAAAFRADRGPRRRRESSGRVRRALFAAGHRRQAGRLHARVPVRQQHDLVGEAGGALRHPQGRGTGDPDDALHVRAVRQSRAAGETRAVTRFAPARRRAARRFPRT